MRQRSGGHTRPDGGVAGEGVEMSVTETRHVSVTRENREQGESRRFGKDPPSLPENALDGLQTRSGLIETRSAFVKREP